MDLAPKKEAIRGSSQLIDACLREMAEAGYAGASARVVAARARVSASAINYSFGSIERLYESSQREALDRTRRWLETWRMSAEEAGEPWPIHAFPAFAASVIDLWCSEERICAQAEACDVLNQAWRPTETARLWSEVWEHFWAAMLPWFSLDVADAPMVAAVLHSERLGHLAHWRRPYDRAALEEVCTRLVARLSRDAALLDRPAPWRIAAERRTLCETPLTRLAETRARIARAVIVAADQGGEAGITHRAVATAAGLSLGAVTHHFPTRAALTAAGYMLLRQNYVEAAGKQRLGAAPSGDLAQVLMSVLDMGRTTPHLRAIEALFLSATRDTAHSSFAAMVRYSRGSSTYGFLKPTFPHLERLDAVLLSNWIVGVGRAEFCGHLASGKAIDAFQRWSPIFS